jgi:hypothetical protein
MGSVFPLLSFTPPTAEKINCAQIFIVSVNKEELPEPLLVYSTPKLELPYAQGGT